MAARDRPVSVPGEDHLALLGHLEVAVHRAGGLRADRPIGWSPSATQRPAPPVEQRQLHAILRRPRGQCRLRVVQGQRRGKRTCLFRGVRVAEHDLEPALDPQPLADRRELEHLVEDLRCVREVVQCLEERDDVDHRSLLAPRVACQLIDGGDVGRGPREADHVPAAAVDAKSSLQRGHDVERVEHVTGEVRQRSPRANLCQRPLMHLAVLAYLELGQVKAECLGLPQQALDLAHRQTGGARCGERVADRAQVVHQLGRRGVGEGLLEQSGRPQPSRHLEEKLAMRFRRRFRDSPAHRARGRSCLGIDCQGAADAIRHRLEGEQRVLGVDRHRV